MVGGHALACDTVADSSRIAVAGGSLTEILYFLGAEDRIEAVDATSNYPDAAAGFPSVGYVRNLSAEGLLSLNPSLVLGENDMGPPEVLAQLRQTGVDVVRVPEEHTAAGIADKIRCVARVLGIDATQRIEQSIAPMLRSLAATPPSSCRVALLLGFRDGAPLAAGGDTSGDGLLRMAGAKNLFGDLEGWKPVSLEAMAYANPHYIVMPERGTAGAGGMDDMRGYGAIRLTQAGKRDNIVVMDGMAMLGFGPRTLRSAVRLADILAAGETTTCVL